MRYVTIAELSDMIRKNLWKIPHDIDLVVGIPRSGMLPASLIALYLNTRLSDIDSFVEGRTFSNGLSRGVYVKEGEIKKVLVVDDSIYGGNALNNAKNKLGAIQNKNYEYVFCTPIATSDGAKKVDLCFEIIDGDRVFEWNIFHHPVLSQSCVDIDGVLCVDPVIDDDGKVYEEFLKTANPLFVPTYRINTLISCRLEKYRSLTEAWLSKHSIEYDNLVLLDFPDKATRIAWNKHGDYKGEYFNQREDCILFVESSYFQAKRIADISNKPVYCVETNSMIQTSPRAHISIKKRIFHSFRSRFPEQYQQVRKLFNKG